MAEGAAGRTHGELGLRGYADATVIGRGGFGVVYRARQSEFGRDVAVKLLQGADLSDRSLARFERERKAMGAVSSHPNIVTVYDAGLNDLGVPYLVMEYMTGGTLQQRITRDGPLPLPEALAITVKLAGALEAAHQAGVLHLDVKPENVLLSAYGEPQLADFGIARLAGQGTRSAMITASVAHAAPEILSELDPTPAADVYSLASTLYAMLAGHAPHAAPGERVLAAIITRVLTVDPNPIATIPAELNTAILRALAKNSGDRYPTAVSFGETLRDIGRRHHLATPEVPTPRSHATQLTAPAPSPPTATTAAADTAPSAPKHETDRVAAAHLTTDLPGGLPLPHLPTPSQVTTAQPRRNTRTAWIAAAAVVAVVALIGISLAALGGGDNDNGATATTPSSTTPSTPEDEATPDGATPDGTVPLTINETRHETSGGPVFFDLDSDDDVTVTLDPTHGKVFTGEAVLTYRPEPGYSGPDRIEWTSCPTACETHAAVIEVTAAAPSVTADGRFVFASLSPEEFADIEFVLDFQAALEMANQEIGEAGVEHELYIIPTVENRASLDDLAVDAFFDWVGTTVTASQEVVSCSPDEAAATYDMTVSAPLEVSKAALAELINIEGHLGVAIIAGPYAREESVAALRDVLEEVGIFVAVDRSETSDEASALAVLEARAPGIDGLVLLEDDASDILAALHEAGVGPGDIPVYLDFGTFSVGPGSEIAGARQVTFSPIPRDGDPRFGDRLAAFSGEAVTAYNIRAWAYDCVVMTALAVEAAGTDDPAVFRHYLRWISIGGTECSGYTDCAALLADGTDIDYRGASGALDLDENLNPTSGSFDFVEYNDQGFTEVTAGPITIEAS